MTTHSQTKSIKWEIIIIFSLIVLVDLPLIVTFGLVVDNSLRSIKIMTFVGVYCTICFGLTFLLLSVATIVVIKRLKEFTGSSNNWWIMTNEQRNIIILLVVFDITFLFRMTLELTVFRNTLTAEWS